jgi:hypothetical protein
MGRTLTTVEKNGQKIKHREAGTLGEIVGYEDMGYAGKLLHGFRVKCLEDGVERFLPFDNIEQFEVVE